MKSHDVALLVMCVSAVALLVGMFIGAIETQSHYESEATKHGAAEYDSFTGEWKWKQKEIE